MRKTHKLTYGLVVAKNATTGIETLLEKEGKMNISLTEDSSKTELYARIESRVVKPTLKRLKSETVSGISYI